MTVRDVSAALAGGAGVLLLADLALGWYEVKITAGGVTVVSTTSTGWSHFGVIAGLLTLGLVAYMLRPLRGGGELDITQAAVSAMLGLAVLAFTVAAALTASASVAGPAGSIEVGTHLWPAYLGVGLGGVVALGTATALALFLSGATAPPATGRHASGTPPERTTAA